MSEKRFTLRMDTYVFDAVRSSAATNRRSIAKEIEYILAEHFGVPPFGPDNDEDLKELNVEDV